MFDNIPAYQVTVNTSEAFEPIETWRLCLGIGGINSIPAAKAVGIAGFNAVKALKLPMIRIFLQEYLNVLRKDKSYDWSLIDAYIYSAAELGKVMAAFCLKPPVLFGKKDQRIIYPDDLTEWENFVAAVSQRYKGIITHWEVGNETDIGEWGGCPLLIEDDDKYNEYYKFMANALLKGNPEAKIGGSAMANAANGSQISSLISYCKAGNAPLDFISWHIYSYDPEAHASLVKKYKGLLSNWPGTKPFTAVTEWAGGFPPEAGSVAETADDPHRTASYFAIACRYLEEKLDYSFFYHLYDCTCYHHEFENFFSAPEIMDKHWNQIPHRFGMFGHDGRSRPHYQLWQMMCSLKGKQLSIKTEYPGFYSMAGLENSSPTVILCNYDPNNNGLPVMADIWFEGLVPGIYDIEVKRIYGRENLADDGLSLKPLDKRDISTSGKWRCPVYMPPDSVIFISLTKR